MEQQPKYHDRHLAGRPSPVFDPTGTITAAAAFSASGILPTSTSGFIGGGQIGYNWQFYNSFVAGVEADIQGVAASNSRGSAVGAAPLAGIIADFSYVSVPTATRSLDYLGTVRGRLGWLFTPTLLVYGTGGLAYGGVTANASYFTSVVGPIPIGIDPSFGAASFSDTRVGWTAGAGLEWMFWPNWSAKVEYLYYDLGRVTYSPSRLSMHPASACGAITGSRLVSQVSTRFNGNIVRAGVNYHFNWGAPAPVVAKY